jgi:hypothetical protein
MKKDTNAISGAFSTIQRLRPVVSPGHRDWKQFAEALAVIYDFCSRQFRTFSGCRCTHSPHCLHEIEDFVGKAVQCLDGCFAAHKAINFPCAYLQRICRNIWLKAQDDIRWRETHEVAYDEEPSDESEAGEPNWSRAISQVVADRGRFLPSWAEVNLVILRNLNSRRLTITEVKLFLRFYRNGETLKDLAALYHMKLPTIFRLKAQVIFCLRDDFAICLN